LLSDFARSIDLDIDGTDFLQQFHFVDIHVVNDDTDWRMELEIEGSTDRSDSLSMLCFIMRRGRILVEEVRGKILLKFQHDWQFWRVILGRRGGKVIE
jgi:hypothetical protein